MTMPASTLVPCLVKLRSEFNELAPNRDKASDGWIGDAAHSASKSDHNPAPDGQVHAIDVDRDLRQPGVTMEDVVQHILERCRSGQETRLKYVIFNKRIWSASNSWRKSDYHGSNPHDHHAHFSASYAADKEADTRPWHLTDLEDDMPLNESDLNKIRTIVREEVDKRIDALKLTTAPSATENADAVWQRFRNDVKAPISDTAVNRIEAEITEAIVAGRPVPRFPNNTK